MRKIKKMPVIITLLALVLFSILFVVLKERNSTPSIPVFNFSNEVSTVVQERNRNESKAKSSETLFACMDELEAQVKDTGMDFKEGSVVVSFFEETSFQEALNILSAYNLSPEEGETKSLFETNRYITVSVPSGREFDIVCNFRVEDEVRGAILNVLLPTAN